MRAGHPTVHKPSSRPGQGRYRFLKKVDALHFWKTVTYCTRLSRRKRWVISQISFVYWPCPQSPCVSLAQSVEAPRPTGACPTELSPMLIAAILASYVGNRTDNPRWNSTTPAICSCSRNGPIRHCFWTRCEWDGLQGCVACIKVTEIDPDGVLSLISHSHCFLSSSN